MGQEFRIKLVKTSTSARIWGFLANIILFAGFIWLSMVRQVSTGRLMLIMIPATVAVYLLAGRWLAYPALATVEATRLLIQPLKMQETTVISFSEVESFSLEKTRKTELLRFKLTDGTIRELDGIMSAGDTFAEFVKAVERAAAEYRGRHPGFMARGAGFEDAAATGKA